MKKKFTPLDIVLGILLTGFGITIIVPFYNTLVVSFMSEKEYVFNKFALFPRNPTFAAYYSVMQKGWIFSGYASTLFIVFFTVILSLFVLLPAAYALSRPAFPGKMLFMNVILFTMFFTGGTVPFYLMVSRLGLIDTLWSIILPAVGSVFYMLLLRNYMSNLPDSVIESAKLDGAGDFRILWSIIMPISAPVIATVVLFISVDQWNEWFRPLLFIKTSSRYPLQLALRALTETANTTQIPAFSQTGQAYVEGVKMAAVVLTMLPIMVVYPFIQKYFVKSIMVGAVKG